MNTYSKPLVIVNEETAEGIYAASGSYSVDANIYDRPQDGRGDYHIHVNGGHGHHHGSHGGHRTLRITFNQPVDYQRSNGRLVGNMRGNSTSIMYSNWDELSDSVGSEEIVVSSDAGLSILSVEMVDSE